MKTKRVIEETNLVDDCDSLRDDLSDFLDSSENLKEPKGKKTGKWTAEEDGLLQTYVPKYGEKSWKKISEHIPGRSSIQCLHRWSKILKPGLVKGPWTAEEDERLKTWVSQEGPTKWSQASVFINGRSGKQCRERWFNTLNPNVKKGNWSQEEDNLIFELYQKYGSSWSKIARLIPGRTENAIKNRFYSTSRKLAADKKKFSEDFIKESMYEEPDSEQDETFELMNSSKQENNLYKLLQGKELTEVIPNKDAVGKISMEDCDGNFESFLLRLNSTSSQDLAPAPPKLMTNSDVGYFDELQDKILAYCNSNIQDIASALKAFNNTQKHFPESNKNEEESALQNQPGFEETSNRPIYHKKVKNIQISAPVPITHIGAKKEMKKTPPKVDDEENLKNLDIALEGFQDNDCEQRMSSLFKQLHSLEGLLKNAKSELMKLESSLDLKNESTDEYIKTTSTGISLDGEEIYKKRRLNNRV